MHREKEFATTVQGSRGGPAPARFEKIDGQQSLQFGVQLDEFGLVSSDPACREMSAALLFAQRPGKSIQFGGNARVIFVAGAPKQLDDLLVGGAFDGFGAEDR